MPPRRELLIAGASIILAISALLIIVRTGEGDTSDQLAELNAAAVQLGATVYSANCASCHGVSGVGQPNWQQRGADGTLPAPPHDASGHTWHHADRLLYGIIRDGGAQFAGPTTPSGMPAFGSQLSETEIRATVTYLKSLWGERERSFQASVSASDPAP